MNRLGAMTNKKLANCNYDNYLDSRPNIHYSSYCWFRIIGLGSELLCIF